VSGRGRGTLRGMAAGFLGLIALQAVGTKGGSGRIAEAFGDVAGLIQRAFDPNVPAIPDRRGIDPNSPGAQAAAAVAAGKAKGGITQTTADRFGGRLPIPAPPN
jgi:hypothetical protein